MKDNCNNYIIFDSHFFYVKDLSSTWLEPVQVASTRLEGELQAVADAQVAGFFVGVGDDGSIFESRFYFCHFKTCWSKNDMFAPKKSQVLWVEPGM